MCEEYLHTLAFIRHKKMTKKIAIPMENGKLCSHFGHCAYFAIATIENNQLIEITEMTPPKHEPGVYPRWIATFGVTDVIAGGMGQKAIDLFNKENINAFVGAPIKDATNIVLDFINGALSLNANYCNHDDQANHTCQH